MFSFGTDINISKNTFDWFLIFANVPTFRLVWFTLRYTKM